VSLAPVRVILNADDFGSSRDVNAAIARAYRAGTLTSASLMVTGEAVDEAVALAYTMPGLAVGLHIVVADGKAALPPANIPHLVDAQGYFPTNPFIAGLRYALNRSARQELVLELTAQFERFAATGLPLSHVDGHLLLHLHPTVFDLLLPLAERYGASGLRVPRDELLSSLPYGPPGLGVKLGWAVAFGWLGRRGLRRIRRGTQRRNRQGDKLVIADRVHGLMQSGHMTEDYVVHLLQRLRGPIVEIYFHPSIAAGGHKLGPNPGDLAALSSPRVREIIRERHLQLTTYPALRAEAQKETR